jgi:hypothetical protein
MLRSNACVKISARNTREAFEMDTEKLHDQLYEIASTAAVDASSARGEIESRAHLYRRHRRRVTSAFVVFSISGLLVVLIVVATSGGGSESVRLPPAQSNGTTTPSPNPRAAKTALKATAAANAKAWLTGTPEDIKRLQGPECVSTESSPHWPRDLPAFSTFRTVLNQVGRSPGTIKIVGVRVRNVTATSGEAEVEYNLPAAVVGNSNWVTFKRLDGRWKVADCRLPFNGDVQNSLSLTPTT